MTESGSHPEPIEQLIEQFSKLPGIGRRSAERMAFHILKQSPDDAMALSRAIDAVKKDVQPCSICCNLSHVDPCLVCNDPRRDASTILVVEHSRDLISLEETAAYRGVYHVLGGHLDPLSGVDLEQLSVTRLLRRVDEADSNSRGESVREVIMGLNPDMEGDSTALYLGEELAARGVKVSRLARGLPAGTQLSYASRAVLSDAITGRQSVD